MCCDVIFNFYAERFSQFSDYSRLIRVVALCLKWVKSFRSKTRTERDVLSVSDLDDAKIRVIRLVQVPLYSLLNSPLMQQHSPFVDDYGVIRVGGRLSRLSGSTDF